MQTHEKTCGKSVPAPTVHVKGAQDAFLKNVNLFKRGQSMPTPRKIKESERPRAANYEKVHGVYVDFNKCSTIFFSLWKSMSPHPLVGTL